MTREQIVETMARAIYGASEHYGSWEFATTWERPCGGTVGDLYRSLAEAALTALEAAGMVVVPVEPTAFMEVDGFTDGMSCAEAWRKLLPMIQAARKP